LPIYNGSGSNSLTRNPVPPTVLYPGDSKYLFGVSPNTPGTISTPNDDNVEAETLVDGNASIAICLAPRPGGGAPPGLMVQVFMTADPGAAEVDVQDAAVDADGAYITVDQITVFTNNGSVYVAWTELEPEAGAFIRVACVLNPNAVSMVVKATYV
jgi:hypothetical protein